MEKIKETPTIIKHINGWEVRIGSDNNLYCTCPAWRFQKLSVNERKQCKHIAAFKEALMK